MESLGLPGPRQEPARATRRSRATAGQALGCLGMPCRALRSGEKGYAAVGLHAGYAAVGVRASSAERASPSPGQQANAHNAASKKRARITVSNYMPPGFAARYQLGKSRRSKRRAAQRRSRGSRRDLGKASDLLPKVLEATGQLVELLPLQPRHVCEVVHHMTKALGLLRGLEAAMT